MTTGRALLHLSRPLGSLWVPVLPLVFYGFAHWDRALAARRPLDVVLVAVAWYLLSVGALWLNAALDRDEADVLFGRAVPVPHAATPAAYVALCLAVMLALWADPVAGLCALLCSALAVLYSHPRVALKGHPLGGPLVNLVGYGLLSPLAGWVLVGVAFNARTALALGLVTSWVMCIYFAAQAFQGPEDRARGYRTLVVTHGPVASLRLSELFMAMAVLVLSVAAVVGWLPRGVLLSLVGFVPALWHLRRWSRQIGGGTQVWARGLVLRAGLGGMLVLGATATEYIRGDVAGEPVAGLGTASGHPTDRPALPANLLRALDASRSHGD